MVPRIYSRRSLFAISTFLLQSVCAQQLLTLTLTKQSTIGSSVVTVSSPVTLSIVTQHNTQPLNSYEALATFTETYSTESILTTLTTTATWSILTAATSTSTDSGIVIVSFPSISPSQTSFISTLAATHSASSSSTSKPTNSPERHRFSSGAIGGIAIGCVAAVFFVCGGLFFDAQYLRKQKERKQYTLAQPSSEKEATARTKVIQDISSPVVGRSELEGIETWREAPATNIVELQGHTPPQYELGGTSRTYEKRWINMQNLRLVERTNRTIV